MCNWFPKWSGIWGCLNSELTGATAWQMSVRSWKSVLKSLFYSKNFANFIAEFCFNEGWNYYRMKSSICHSLGPFQRISVRKIPQAGNHRPLCLWIDHHYKQEKNIKNFLTETSGNMNESSEESVTWQKKKMQIKDSNPWWDRAGGDSLKENISHLSPIARESNDIRGEQRMF